MTSWAAVLSLSYVGSASINPSHLSFSHSQPSCLTHRRLHSRLGMPTGASPGRHDLGRVRRAFSDSHYACICYLTAFDLRHVNSLDLGVVCGLSTPITCPSHRFTR